MPGAPGAGAGAAAMTKKEAAAVATAPRACRTGECHESSLRACADEAGHGRLCTLPFGHVHDFANLSCVTCRLTPGSRPPGSRRSRDRLVAVGSGLGRLRGIGGLRAIGGSATSAATAADVSADSASTSSATSSAASLATGQQHGVLRGLVLEVLRVVAGHLVAGLAAATSGGSVVLQTSVAFQHRVWKRQPLGGEIGEGTSPLSRMRSLLAPRRLRVRHRHRRHQRLGVRVHRRLVQRRRGPPARRSCRGTSPRSGPRRAG